MKPQFRKMFGPRMEELMKRAAMLYSNLDADAKVPVDHAKLFVNQMLGLDMDYEDFLSQVSFESINPTGTSLDDWELDDVGDIRKHTENTANTHLAGENWSDRKITPQIIDLLADLPYERVGRWLRRSAGEGATLGSGVDIVLKELRIKFRRELQNLFINGNTDSTAAHESICDGWVKLSIADGDVANLNGTSWAATPDIKAMLMRLRRQATQIRHGSLLKMPNFGYIMSEYCHDVFVEQLAALTSDSAHSLYFIDPKTGVPRYKGRPIYMPNYWPDDLIIMTTPKNFAGGLCDEISRDIPLIEYERDARPAVHKFTCRVSGGCNIVKPSIILAEYDTTNTNYTTWVA